MVLRTSVSFFITVHHRELGRFVGAFPRPCNLHDYATPRALQAGLAEDFPDYNEERIHAALDYRTPWAVYHEAA